MPLIIFYQICLIHVLSQCQYRLIVVFAHSFNPLILLISTKHENLPVFLSESGLEVDLISSLIEAFGHWNISNHVLNSALSKQNLTKKPTVQTPVSTGCWGHVQLQMTWEDHQGFEQTSLFCITSHLRLKTYSF